MEPDGAAISATAVSSSTPHDPDLSPVGLPEIEGLSVEEEVEEAIEEEEAAPPPPPSDQTPTLSDDLRDKIIKQVEYYFSNENLPTDKLMMKFVSKNVDGFVPIAVIASFNKMKRLTKERLLIVEALKQSSFLVVSPNGKKVRRLHPISSEVKDPMLRIVLVENLPEDHSLENIRRIFGAAGDTKNICIRDPQTAKEPTKLSTAEKMVSGKLHALVEYETVEAAEKAVALLNNQQDWRFGMRVKLLKRVDKHGEKKKTWREIGCQNNHNGEASYTAGLVENHPLSEHHDDSHDEEKQEGDQKEKNGQKGQNRRHGSGRGQKYRGTNGHGHGTLSSSYGNGNELPKPPPGPKMPDGTKGFTMGRGRPLAPTPI